MKKIITLCLGLFIAAVVHAQSAANLTDIVKANKASWQSLTYLAFFLDESNAQDESLQDITPAETFDFFKSQGLVPSNVQPGTTLRYDYMAEFLLKSFNIPAKSILYLATGNRRYAFRQMQQIGLYSASTFPSDVPSGSFFVTMLGQFSEMYPRLSLTYSGSRK